jgi:hypothetical protein
MPAGFQGRTADNWRSLLAIADDLGVDYGEAARAAAVVLGSDRQYENPNVTLLIDIRTVFDMYGADRLGTKRELIPALVGLEESLWSEWTGLDDTAAPHMLTQGDIGRLLRPFRIRSKTIWPPRRDAGTKSETGYYRSQFEAAWASYCEPSATASCRDREAPHARHTSPRRMQGFPYHFAHGVKFVGIYRCKTWCRHACQRTAHRRTDIPLGGLSRRNSASWSSCVWWRRFHSCRHASQ